MVYKVQHTVTVVTDNNKQSIFYCFMILLLLAIKGIALLKCGAINFF